MKSNLGVSGQKYSSISLPCHILKKKSSSFLCPDPVTSLWAFKLTYSARAKAAASFHKAYIFVGADTIFSLSAGLGGGYSLAQGKWELLSCKEQSYCAQQRPKLETSTAPSPLQQIWVWIEGGAWGPSSGPAWLPAGHWVTMSQPWPPPGSWLSTEAQGMWWPL